MSIHTIGNWSRRASLPFCAAVLLAGPATAEPQMASQVVEGRLAQITTTQVTIEGVGTFRIDMIMAKCFDFRGDATTCETLVGVGYADKARVTIVGDLVRRVDILELQQ